MWKMNYYIDHNCDNVNAVSFSLHVAIFNHVFKCYKSISVYTITHSMIKLQ